MPKKKLTREELEAKLTELNLPFTADDTDEQLAAVLEANKPEKEEKPKKDERTSITLRAKKNHNLSAGHIRTFSREQHGENFMKHAEDWKKAYDAEEVE